MNWSLRESEQKIVATRYIQVGSSYEELQARLDEAVRNENYGAAALLRDQMRYYSHTLSAAPLAWRSVACKVLRSWDRWKRSVTICVLHTLWLLIIRFELRLQRHARGDIK